MRLFFSAAAGCWANSMDLVSDALLMKIPARRRKPPEQVSHIHKVFSYEVPNLALALPNACDSKQSGIHKLLALLLAHAFPDNHLHGSELIFQRNKNHALGCFWLLPESHDAASPYEASVWHVLKFL
jgi:hypothetical protein